MFPILAGCQAAAVAALASTGTAVVRLDHGVVPSNDLGASFAFLQDVLGGHLDSLIGINKRGLDREVPQLVFFTLANHHGFGAALQDAPIPPPARHREGTIWGFETDERGIAAVASELRRRGVALEGPVEYPSPSPLAASLFLTDPFGCGYEICVRRDEQQSRDPGQGHLGLRRISHVRLEVTDLDLAREWYMSTLELDPGTDVPGERQITLQVASTGQLFILREVPEMSPRTTNFFHGPHVDVKCPVGAFNAVAARIENPERYQGPRSHETPWREPNQPTVYFYDPFYNRLQLSEIQG